MKNDKRTNTEDTGATPVGAVEQPDSGEVESIPEHAELLDKEAESRGTLPAENEQGRAEADRPEPKVKSFKIKATVATGQYQNIQPEIELENVSIAEGEKIAMPYIKSIFTSFSEQGSLKEKAITETIKSFNEDVEIEYDPISHSYFYQGRRLQGATDFVKGFYKPFDAMSIAPACAKAWDCDEAEIKDIWAKNSDVSSTLGTLIHQVLENYDFHGETGAKIAEKKKLDDNYVMPKHPILQQIVKGFIEVNKTTGQGHPEVIITDIEAGYCGRADKVLVTGEKTCRIQDYKVNIDSDKEDKSCQIIKEPFKDLPATKLSKYALQLNLYRQMLEKSGWKVEGLDVFVLEGEWKHYELPLLDKIY